MRLSMIAALDRNGLIGKGSGLPWRLPADLKHFKEVTMHKPVIMGRKTFDSIGKPLPGRRNIVLSRSGMPQVADVEVFASPDAVLNALAESEEAIVIGGSEIYRAFWPRTAMAYITLVDAECEGDTWFPEWPLDTAWTLKSAEKRPSDEKNVYDVTFMVFEKVENL